MALQILPKIFILFLALLLINSHRSNAATVSHGKLLVRIFTRIKFMSRRYFLLIFCRNDADQEIRLPLQRVVLYN